MTDTRESPWFTRSSERHIALQLLEDLYTEAAPVFAEGALWTYEAESGLYRARPEHELRAHVGRYDGQPVGPPDEKTGKAAKRLSVQFRTTQAAVRCAQDMVRDDDFFADATPAVAFSDGALVVDNNELRVEDLSPDLKARFGFDFPVPSPSSPPPRPLWDRFAATVFEGQDDGEDRLRLLGQFVAATVFGLATRYGRMLLLLGGGGTGKSTLLRVVEGLVPASARCSISPADLEKPHYRAELAGARLNSLFELSGQDVLRDNALKRIAVGEPVQARRLYGHPFRFEPAAAHLLACNSLPATPGCDSAWWERWTLLGFERRFRNTDNEVKNLGQRIAAEERPGVVAWALGELPGLLEAGQYAVPESSKKLLSRWQREGDPVRAFLTDCTVEIYDEDDPSKWPTATDVYERYKEWSDLTGHRRCSLTTFGRRVAEAGVERRRLSARHYALTLRKDWQQQTGGVF